MIFCAGLEKKQACYFVHTHSNAMKSNSLLQQSLRENAAVYNADMSLNYRRYDEQFIHTPAYTHIAGKISALTSAFQRPISILDIGCGTGRYFHALHNARSIMGIDVSPEMLREARTPFGAERLANIRVELVSGNFYDHEFGGRKFDFIYSIGVLGEHTVFDSHVAGKMFELLREGGVCFFSVVDIEPRKNAKRRLAEVAYPFLPRPVKAVLDKRWETCYMTLEQLTEIMNKQNFRNFEIERYISEDPLWEGVHLECIARK